MALRDHRTLGRESAVDQTDVGVADAAERHLDQYLAGAGFGNRHILDDNGFRLGIEPLGAHGPGHCGPSLAAVCPVGAYAAPVQWRACGFVSGTG